MRMRVAFVAVAIFVLYVAFLGRHGVLQQTEARYAEVSREMKVSRDFLMPTLNGVPHVQKPPVTYWLAAVSMMVFGENEIGARAAPLAAGFGVLLLTAWIGTLWFDRKVGIIALLLLAASVEFFVLSRTLCADMILTFWSTAAIAAFAYATCRVKQPSTLHFMPFFVFMGVAFATKGPMGIVVPLCATAGWQLYSRRRGDRHQRMPWLIGIMITLVLAGGWFVAVVWRYPELWAYFLKYELIERFFSNVHGRSKPFWYFLPVLAGGWFPWTPLIIPIAFRTFGTKDHGRSGQARWTMAGWVVIPFIVLSLSGSKLATYILPLLPGVALWFASRLVVVERGRPLTVAVSVQMLLFLTLGAAAPVALLSGSLLPPTVTTDAWFLPLWTLAIGVVLTTCWQMRKGVTVQRVAASSLASLLVLAVLSSQLKSLAPVMGSGVSLRPLAARIRREPGWEQAQIIVAGTRGHGLEFYLRRLVDNTLKDADVALPLTPDLAARIHPSVEDIRFATNKGPCFVVTKERNLRRGQFAPPKWAVMQREGVFVLLQRSN